MRSNKRQAIFSRAFEDFAHGFAKWTGSTLGFVAAFLSVLAWIAAGGRYGYSTEWENAFAIYISSVNFLMIFLMQRAQNKALDAVQVKLNELIAAVPPADNKLINVEELSEKEISEVRKSHRHMTGKKL